MRQGSNAKAVPAVTSVKNWNKKVNLIYIRRCIIIFPLVIDQMYCYLIAIPLLLI